MSSSHNNKTKGQKRKDPPAINNNVNTTTKNIFNTLNQSNNSNNNNTTQMISNVGEDFPDDLKWLVYLMDKIKDKKYNCKVVTWEDDKQATKDANIIMDESTHEQTNIITGKSKITKTLPVTFIRGEESSAVARETKLAEINNLEIDNKQGKKLLPCFAHGNYVSVENLELDHLFPKDKILERQKSFIALLNEDKELGREISSLPGMNKFIYYDEENKKFYGTLFFYKFYFNDIDNLWLICHDCNKNKSDLEPLKWLDENPFFGKKFKDALFKFKLSNPEEYKLISEGNRIASFAAKWFWENHANYVTISRQFIEDVTVPTEILNHYIDKIEDQEKAAGLKILTKRVFEASKLLVDNVVSNYNLITNNNNTNVIISPSDIEEATKNAPEQTSKAFTAAIQQGAKEKHLPTNKK
jgi:5-methylcytosine-specific restriction endonuclease McrA